jgi:hypothetical protein
MKSRIAHWIAGRLGGRARALRRSLRDYQRHEYARIFQLERRSRGLRLYAAWTQKNKGDPYLGNAGESAIAASFLSRRHEGCRLTGVGRQSQLRATTMNLTLAGIDLR